MYKCYNGNKGVIPSTINSHFTLCCVGWSLFNIQQNTKVVHYLIKKCRYLLKDWFIGLGRRCPVFYNVIFEYCLSRPMKCFDIVLWGVVYTSRVMTFALCVSNSFFRLSDTAKLSLESHNSGSSSSRDISVGVWDKCRNSWLGEIKNKTKNQKSDFHYSNLIDLLDEVGRVSYIFCISLGFSFSAVMYDCCT
jgi:hypothetical protein